MAQADQVLSSRLAGSGLDFVIVGGVCAVYYGVPVATFHLDICCPFREEHALRIESALRGLNPVHRLTPNRLPLELTRSAYGELRNLYLQTDAGMLDCLGTISGVGDFTAAREHSVAARLSYGEFRFLDLQTLILSKAALGRERDWIAVRQLRAIEERLAGQPKLL